jgi:hypothetical protein
MFTKKNEGGLYEKAGLIIGGGVITGFVVMSISYDENETAAENNHNEERMKLKWGSKRRRIMK